LGPLGFPELLFILVLALLIFGPRKIPEIGRTLGKAMGEFRRATTDFKRTLNVEAALAEERPPRPAPRAAPSSTEKPSPAAPVPQAEAAATPQTPSGDEPESPDGSEPRE
jgi:sec-independent protein translocase protein TatB